MIRNCGSCFYYRPTRSDTTGRVLSSQPGKCMWRPEWPTAWAESYLTYHGDQPVPFVVQRGVWPAMGAKCEVWEKKRRSDT